MYDKSNEEIISMVKLLELPMDQTITKQMVSQSYRTLAKKYHPDTGDSKYKDGKMFIAVGEAKKYISANLDHVNVIVANFKAGFLKRNTSSSSSNTYNRQQSYTSAEKMQQERAWAEFKQKAKAWEAYEKQEEAKAQAQYNKKKFEEYQKKEEEIKKAKDDLNNSNLSKNELKNLKKRMNDYYAAKAYVDKNYVPFMQKNRAKALLLSLRDMNWQDSRIIYVQLKYVMEKSKNKYKKNMVLMLLLITFIVLIGCAAVLGIIYFNS